MAARGKAEYKAIPGRNEKAFRPRDSSSSVALVAAGPDDDNDDTVNGSPQAGEAGRGGGAAGRGGGDREAETGPGGRKEPRSSPSEGCGGGGGDVGGPGDDVEVPLVSGSHSRVPAGRDPEKKLQPEALVTDLAKLAGTSDEVFSSNYSRKKTIAKGFLDFALMMSNVAQLKGLTRMPPEERDMFYTPIVVMLGLSIGLQVAIAVVLVFLGYYEPIKKKKIKRSEILNNVSIILILVVTFVNLLISVIGISQ